MSKRKYIVFQKLVCLLLIILGPLSVITGCASKPEDVRLASENDILAYAWENYGKANIVNFDARPQEYEYVYTLEDSEGFRYLITSYAEQISLDGSVLGYREQKKSNFRSIYQQHLLSQLSPELKELQKVGISFEDTGYVYEAFCALNVESECFEINSLHKFGEALQKADKRKYFSDASIFVRFNGKEIGEYRLNEQKYYSAKDLEVDYLLEIAASKLRVSKDNLSLIRTTTLPAANIPGLDLNDVRHILGVDEENILCCYFTYQCDTYLVADICINKYDENGNVLGFDRFVAKITEQ